MAIMRRLSVLGLCSVLAGGLGRAAAVDIASDSPPAWLAKPVEVTWWSQSLQDLPASLEAVLELPVQFTPEAAEYVADVAGDGLLSFSVVMVAEREAKALLHQIEDATGLYAIARPDSVVLALPSQTFCQYRVEFNSSALGDTALVSRRNVTMNACLSACTMLKAVADFSAYLVGQIQIT